MRVEIWSDVVCPWCYIGKRRFEAALARFPGSPDVEVTFRAFQLDPGAAPGTATPVHQVYERKFGPAQADHAVLQLAHAHEQLSRWVARRPPRSLQAP